ncbi:hypothetical protein GCM10009623_08440 [Nocardioides aestuarii]|uniref:Uncharacterized protein n=1 Tax=Nocardioides aestuarii TaxID=252231 RepID=A0ABW4TH61_9ACTN
MNTEPIDVTIIAARPDEELFVHVVALDDFERGLCDYLDLGRLVAWRYETFYAPGRTFTDRHPIGEHGDPSGDWEPAEALPEDLHRQQLAACARQVADNTEETDQ